MLKEIVRELKSYPGILRKQSTGKFQDLVQDFFGEDAGFFDLSDYTIVFTTDGIWHKVLERDLYWGGFVSILVNVHDIYAMGARPKYAVNVVSATDERSLEEMKRGIADAAKKFGIKMLKGHVHPDAPQNSVDVAMIGLAKKGCVIRSNTAKDGDFIVVAVDLEGKPREGLPYNFDSTDKDSSTLINQFDSMVELAERKIVSAGKDISNPGMIGTIAMMLEASGKGGIVEIDRIPKPEGISTIQWLLSYPACGFCVTTDRPDDVLEVFKKHGLSASVVGRVDSSGVLSLRLGSEEVVFMDFGKESIFGLKTRSDFR